MTMTLNDLYIALRKRFRQENLPQPELEARELAAVAAHADKQQTAGWAYMYLAEETLRHAQELADRHVAGEPLAYLLGEWDFYGLTFQITPAVLIPRPETECLCERAIQFAGQIVNPRVLDLGCGSGCIAIALLTHVDDARAVAVDVSEEALKLTWDNAIRNGVGGRMTTASGNALALPEDRLGRFHLLVSNPPYVTAGEMRELDRSVREYEPHLALFGGDDGLDFYRSIASRWRKAMLPGGRLLVECGWKQAGQVADLLQKFGWLDIEIFEDLSGIPRIVTGVMPTEDAL